MRKTRTFPSILTATFLFLSALLCPLVLSCSGNGGASNMDGDIYIPGGGGYLEAAPAQAAAREHPPVRPPGAA